jgi:hypothetical protein
MAQKVQVLFIDDIDGSEADGTVRFSLDGTDYEIDLNAKHTSALREALARYVDAARRVTRAAAPRVRNRSRIVGGGRQGLSTPSGVSTEEVRAWAKSQGIDVKERGRIPSAIVAEFAANRNGSRASSAPVAFIPPAPLKEAVAEEPGPAKPKGGHEALAQLIEAEGVNGESSAAAPAKRGTTTRKPKPATTPAADAAEPPPAKRRSRAKTTA